MARVKWTTPRRGPGSVEDIVSHKPQVKAHLKSSAESMASTATNVLAVHRDTGDSHIKTVHAGTTDLDSYVILAASGGKKAALSIENGHHWENEVADGVVESGFEPGIAPLKAAVRMEKRLAVIRR